MVSGRIALLVSIIVSAAVGCYRPSILPGGYLCADGGVCPDGFRCAIDKRCYLPDGGPVCSDASPPLTPLCEDLPIGSDECNLVCQTHCPCGRCALSGGVPKCQSAGTRKDVDLCNLAADDCGPGLSCVKDACGTTLARCRRFCRAKPDCAFDCTNSQGSNLFCDGTLETCDPIAGTGCHDSALGCYIRQGKTVCECRGTAQAGALCDTFNQCVTGFQCVAIAPQHAICRAACRTMHPEDCPLATQVCMALSGGFGFCTP